jgi:hypothetical protein
LKKSGIVSLTRSNPFAFSYAIGSEVAAAVLQGNAIATMLNVVRVIATVHIISSFPCGEQKRQNLPREVLGIIADNLSKAGISWGCSSQVDSTGRVLFTADAYSNDGRRFIILSDEKLSAFLELESAIRAASGD